MEYARSPKLPPLVFEAQACAKDRDSAYVGVDVVRCRRNGLNAPFPLPVLCPADGVEPVDGAAGPGLCGGLLRREAVLPQSVAVRGALVPEGFANAGPGRLPLGPHCVGHLRAEPRGRGDAAARAGAHGRRVARGRGAHGQAQRERDEFIFGLSFSASRC